MKSLLLDTHIFIWLSEDATNLPISIRDKIEDTEDVFVSIASFWEISIKLTICKLSLQADFNDIADVAFDAYPINRVW